ARRPAAIDQRGPDLAQADPGALVEVVAQQELVDERHRSLRLELGERVDELDQLVPVELIAQQVGGPGPVGDVVEAGRELARRARWAGPARGSWPGRAPRRRRRPPAARRPLGRGPRRARPGGPAESRPTGPDPRRRWRAPGSTAAPRCTPARRPGGACSART